MIGRDFLERLRSILKIEDVISRYCAVSRRGRVAVCLCPFHSEKSPSFTIYLESQSYYCFGCGAGGDIITFIRQIEHLEYRDAVQYLSNMAGISMPEDESPEEKRAAQLKLRIYDLNKAAARFFFRTLRCDQNKKGMRYFLSRGLSADTVKKYGLGYASDSWDNLITAMKAEGFSQSELVTAGLCKIGKNNAAYQVFRDRVMFPIIDVQGRVVGFGGRIIDGTGPKYLNTGDTPVFQKSRQLFSFHLAKKEPDTRDYVLLAEGYMDVIALYQAGFRNVVATLGTALTKEQVRLLQQYTKEVVIAYDADGAGQTAGLRAIKLLEEVGIPTRMLQMEGAKDPDEFIKQFGAERFRLLINGAIGTVEFLMNRAAKEVDVSSDQGEITFLKKAVEIISELTSKIEREIYISRLSVKHNISKEVLASQVESIVRRKEKSQNKQQWREITTGTVVSNPEHVSRLPTESMRLKETAARLLLCYLINNPEEILPITKQLGEKSLPSEFYQKVYGILSGSRCFSREDCFFVLGESLSVREMGEVMGILAKSRDIYIGKKEAQDYISALTRTQQGIVAIDGKEELSDEEFLELSRQLKIKKTRIQDNEAGNYNNY